MSAFPQLALWGLRGVSTLDPTLSPDLRDGMVLLRQGQTVLFKRAAPPDTDAEAWGALVADLAASAWDSSAAVQGAGQQAVISSFFDELFNHLDPYSRYVPPAAADEDRARRSGEAGAGLQIGKVGREFVVQGVNTDGPGAEAGIRVGAVILAVDDQPTRGEDLDSVLARIVGVEGTALSLTVRGPQRAGPNRGAGTGGAAAGDGVHLARRRYAGGAHHRLQQRHRSAGGPGPRPLFD